jgi:ZIP family zinc transporter
MPNTIVAFLLSLIAGLSTGVGGLIGIFTKRNNDKFLTFALGLSAGVMIFISFVELLPESIELLRGDGPGGWGTTVKTMLGFFGGMGLIALIDILVPEGDNPHEAGNWNKVADIKKGSPEEKQHKARLHRTGVMTAIAIVAHNFPEGMATFVSAIRDPHLALPIVIAIAIHNIPEGIAVAAPIYFATGSRKRGLVLAFLSGLAEPVGALLAWLVLAPFLSDTLYGILYSAIAGIMVYISFDELLPSAEKYKMHHLSIFGVASGMGIMALSLALLK